MIPLARISLAITAVYVVAVAVEWIITRLGLWPEVRQWPD
jgi:hypothetical protein